jgi:putative nucleotidyltransferase with HDIG domain
LQGRSDIESRVEALSYRRFTFPLDNGMQLAINFKTTSYEIGYYCFGTFLSVLFFVALLSGVFLVGYITKKINPELFPEMDQGIFDEIGGAGSGGGSLGEWIEGYPEGDFAESGAFQSKYATESKTVEEKLQDDNRSLRFLHNMSRFFSSVSDVHQVLDEFSEVLLKSMINTNCRIALFDEDRNHIYIETDKTITGHNPYSQKDKKFPIQVITKNRHVIGNEIIKVLRAGDLGDKLNAIDWEFFFPNELQSVLFISLNARGRCLGYVLLGEKRHWERSPFNQEKIEFCMTLVNQAIVAMECVTLYKENHDIYSNAVSSLTNTLDARDPYTHDHSRGVTQYAMLLAQSLGMDDKQLETINNAGLLHDIGKIAIPDSILHKPGELTSMEFQLIKEHPIRGAKILEPVKEFRDMIPVVAHHHEHYDGNGYYAQLKGEEIPLGARILAIADAFHAMISDRPYRQGLSVDVAVNELIRCKGTQFDPKLVDIFVNCITSSEPARQSPQYAAN